ncbi:MAG TPA: thioredoxin domain-containing protein [Candidatus Angelobacter sp.]|nr:thioredoxin domain-containing protein [Candidatus Angelobacter sp.]
MLPFIRASALAVLSACAFSASAVDASVLKPPAGAKVAVVVFEDLECPECASAYPLVWQAADAHKIPVMLYDFPLPRHNWSFDAAVWARYFDTQDTKAFKVGNEFRRYIFANQMQISRENLEQWVQSFAAEHEVILPAVNDSDGKLAEKVKADFALGQRIGVEHTPTIWVISNSAVSPPLVEEVKDRGQLSQMIDDMLKKAGLAAKNPAAKAPKPKKGALNRQEKQNQGAKP